MGSSLTIIIIVLVSIYIAPLSLVLSRKVISFVPYKGLLF
jgi:hypothetical protein